MIEVQALSKRFRRVEALRALSLAVKPGIITGIAGPNGCGKSTLIKAILGLVVPDSGSIRVAGEEVRGGYGYRRRIGYVPQEPAFPPNLSVREILALLADVRGVKAERQEEMIERLAISSTLARPFGTLSGGTRHRVAIVAAMMFDVPLLILDEPTVGLDPIAAATLKALLLEAAAAGRTVVLVSHIMSELEQLVAEVFFLLEGRLAFGGTTAEILTRTQTTRLEDGIIAMLKGKGGGQ